MQDIRGKGRLPESGGVSEGETRAWRDLLGESPERVAFDTAVRDGAAKEVLGPWLAFGTAGIRAQRGPGKMHFNQATLSAVALAVLRTLDKPGARVVLGCDARVGGHAAMVNCAERLARAGARALWLPEPVPTPLVAFLAKDMRADLAIMVTASHNPPDYNGAKFFDGEGAQLDDAPCVQATAWLLENTLESVARALLGTRPEEGVSARARDASAPPGSVERVSDAAFSAMADAYITHIKQTLAAHVPSYMPVIAVTPLQGVGGVWLERALEGACGTLDFVASEREPDGTFAAVASPNPEVATALDPLRAQLSESCPLGLALDPDADRLAVVERQPLTGEMRTFQGNEIGLILATFASWSPSEGPAAGLPTASPPGERPIVLTSVVSSAGLEIVGARLGFEVLRSGTGFRRITALKRALGPRARHVVLSFEEALGFALGPDVHDKDGLQAALALLRARAYFERALNTNLLGTLACIDARVGCWRSTSRSVDLQGRPWATDALEARRRLAVAGAAVAPLFADALQQPQVEALAAMAHPLAGDAGQGWNMRLGTKGRVALRSSGTEPKLKLYFDRCHEQLDDDEARAAVEAVATKFTAAFLAG